MVPERAEPLNNPRDCARLWIEDGEHIIALLPDHRASSTDVSRGSAATRGSRLSIMFHRELRVTGWASLWWISEFSRFTKDIKDVNQPCWRHGEVQIHCECGEDAALAQKTFRESNKGSRCADGPDFFTATIKLAEVVASMLTLNNRRSPRGKLHGRTACGGLTSIAGSSTYFWAAWSATGMR